MVAKVISGKTIRGVLNYNENKVKAGVADCILASKFGCQVNELTFSNKLNRFEKLIALNRKTKTNTIHISLNFDVSEKIALEKMNAIIAAYMNRIGFGDQPYLAYQHRDAAHPHVHIVTTNIQSSGQRIDIHNIGRNQSEKARKEIEKTFGLVRAEGRRKEEQVFKPVNPEQAIYGKSETKRTISNVVRMVIGSYKYTSLPEFNAALRQFNVMADRGKEGTRMHDKKGLMYSILDNKGNKVGVPIKASSIYRKPMLSFLEKQFKLNEVMRGPHKEKLKSCIDGVLASKQSLSRAAFMTALNKQSIYVLFRENAEGLIYGVTFVDNKNKVVFNGSDLGKAYSAKAIVARLSSLKETNSDQYGLIFKRSETRTDRTEGGSEIQKLITTLTVAEQHDFASAERVFKRRRKKKRKGRSL